MLAVAINALIGIISFAFSLYGVVEKDYAVGMIGVSVLFYASINLSGLFDQNRRKAMK